MENEQELTDRAGQEVFSQGETIRDHSLEVPMAVEITDYLRARGLDIPRDIVTTEALQEFICQSK